MRSIPGIGDILALTLLYEIDDISRFPTVQDFLSYARLVKGTHESDGKTKKTAGAKMGNAHLKWAFSEAAVLFMRWSTAGKQYFIRIEKKHGKGKALSIVAAKLGPLSRAGTTGAAGRSCRHQDQVRNETAALPLSGIRRITE